MNCHRKPGVLYVNVLKLSENDVTHLDRREKFTSMWWTVLSWRTGWVGGHLESVDRWIIQTWNSLDYKTGTATIPPVWWSSRTVFFSGYKVQIDLPLSHLPLFNILYYYFQFYSKVYFSDLSTWYVSTLFSLKIVS